MKIHAKNFFTGFTRNMQITSNTPKVEFTSRLNPVPPSVMHTVKGKITIYEATKDEIKRNGFAQKLMRFFCKNEASISNHPVLQIFNEPGKTDLCNQIVKVLSDKLKNLLKYDDGNLTLLLAKDKKNKLCGACLSYGYDEIPSVEATTCYIDCIAVDSGFRGLKLGKTMMDKTIQSAQNIFSDMFLKAEVNALGFYKSLGFEELSEMSPNQKKVIDYIVTETLGTGDYQKFLKLCTKPLQKDKSRWYDLASKNINN